MKPQLLAPLLALLAGLAGPAMAQVSGGPAGPLSKGPVSGPPDVGPLPKVRDVAISKRASGPVVAGQTATFALQVTNSGTVPVAGGMGVQVVDVLPAGFTGPISGAGSGWACAASGSTLTCNWVGGAVPPGGSFPPITVTAVAGGSGAYENCARVRLTKAQDMRPGNDRSCVKGPVGKPDGRRHDVGVRKSGPASVGAGQTATFTLLVTNNGPSPVTAGSGLTVRDLLPANFTNVTASGPGWNCTVAGQPAQVECAWVGSAVNAPQQFPAIVIAAVAGKEGVYLNCAEAVLRNHQDVAPRDNRSCVEGRVTEGGGKGYDVGIRKIFKPTSEPGAPGIFVLYPTNNGPATVTAGTGLQVVDTLPANFVPPITAGGGGWTCTTQPAAGGGSPWTVVCDYVGPPAGPGPLPEIELTAAVGKPGGFSNCAEILLRKERDLNPRDNRGCAGGEVTAPSGKKPDVALSKTALDQPWSWPSGTGVYRFRIDNVGDAAVPAGHTFTLTETLPAGMVMISMANAWACSPGAGTTGPATIACTYTSGAPLNPGAWIQFDMVVGFAGRKEPAYVNCATVAVSAKDRPWREVNMANNRDCEPVETRPTPRVSDLKMEKRGPATLLLGQSATYTLDVVNKGPDAVDAGAGIVVTDTLPAQFTALVTVTAPGWTCQVSGLTVSCSFTGSGVFNPGDGLPPITVSAVAGGAGKTQNCAQVARAGDPVVGNNTACVPLMVRRPPIVTENLALSKVAGFASWFPQGILFQLFVTNASTVTIPAGTTLTITDNVPAGLQYVNVWGAYLSPASCGPAGTTGPAALTCSWTLGVPLAPGDSSNITVLMNVIAPAAASYENCATLAASIPESTLADNADCVTTSPPPSASPSLQIEKVVDQDCTGVAPYTACKFSIRIFNTGSTPYTGPLTFTDTVLGPSGVTIGGVSLASPLPPGWTCTGAQPATCTIASATIPDGSYITVPLNMTMAPPIPPKKNCAALTAPVSAQACAPMGSTHYDLGVTGAFTETYEAVNGGQFEFWISSNPTVTNGSQLVFNGSVTTSATLSGMTVASPLWTCTGPPASFLCTLTVSPGAFSGGSIPLRIKVYYSPNDAGQPMAFSGGIQMNGNADPMPSNNIMTQTLVLP